MICNKVISIMEFLAKIHKIVSFKPIIWLSDKFTYILFQSQVRALLDFFFNFYLIVLQSMVSIRECISIQQLL